MIAENRDSEASSQVHGASNLQVLLGLQPALRHARTGESHLAQVVSGVPAPVHGFAGLPDEWIVERDSGGHPTALHPDVVAGYWRDGQFIPLSQLVCMPLDD